jgi:integrase
MGLSVKRVEKLLRQGVPGRHTDGDVKGLMLCIESKSSAAWSLRWQRDHKTHQMGLGSARPGSSSYLSLAAAREKAREQYERLARGIDPLALKRTERAARIAAEAKQVTFKQAAVRYHEAHEKGWSAHHANEFLSSLERWAYPHIGSLDVAAVDKDAVLRVLEQQTREGGTFWVKRVVTADRVRNRIERVLDYATVRAWRSGDNCARWRSYLENVLPAPRKVASVKHLDAVPYGEVPQLMAKLAADESVTGKALCFVILTCVRVSEALNARWDPEIDLAAAEWTIPASRMKGRKEHVVPLSPQVVALLKGLYREEGNPHVFVGTRPGTATAANTVMLALRRAGRSETVHGFRSSFSDWAHERTSHSNHAIELSLAHSIGNSTEKAYRRGDMFTKRRKLMEAWAKYCCTPPVEKQKSDKVVPLHA